jgi:hypothetical protein
MKLVPTAKAVAFLVCAGYAAVVFCAADSLNAAIIGQNTFLATDTVIGFETGSTALPSVSGVTFLSDFSTYGGDATAAPGSANEFVFGRQYYGNLSGTGPELYTFLGIAFSTPQSAAGAYLVDANGPSSIICTVYDSGGVIEESASTQLAPYLSPPSQLPFIAFSEPQGISKIVFSYPTDRPGFFGIDNLVYGAVVPEPASAASAGFSATCLFFVTCGRRRRKSAGTLRT